MGLTAERREVDARLIRAAWARDAEAEVLLAGTIPDAVEAARAALARRRERTATTTRALWQMTLRELAVARQVELAILAHRRADELYWQVVVGWYGLIVRLSRATEAQMRLPDGELRGLYVEAGYVSAIRMDPERAAFGTYLRHWVGSMAPRSPEVASTVLGAYLQGRRVRLSVLSLDMPYPSADDDEVCTLLDWLAAERGEEFARLEAADLLATVRPQLSDLHRAYLDAFRECETLEEVGARFGVGKERARQVRGKLVERIRACAPGI